MQLEIIAPDKQLYSGEIDLIQVPGSKGSFAVLSNHAPIISTLEKGKIRIISRDQKETFIEITGGLIEVKNNEIIVLAEIH